jgi:hypothetical protein
MLVVALDDPGRVVPEPAVALDEPDMAETVVAHPAVQAVVLGRVVQPGLVGQEDGEQAVAVGVALALEPVVVQAQGRERLGGKARIVV